MGERNFLGSAIGGTVGLLPPLRHFLPLPYNWRHLRHCYRRSMELKPRLSSQPLKSPGAFAAPEEDELSARSPLVWLCNTERSLRRKTLSTLAPLLPEPLAINLGETSLVAEESLNQLAEIDLAAISAADLRSARIQVGLVFVGFGALAMVFLLLYLSTLHPDLSPGQQVQRYWHQYVWFVCLGVAGLFMLGREAMRPRD